MAASRHRVRLRAVVLFSLFGIGVAIATMSWHAIGVVDSFLTRPTLAEGTQISGVASFRSGLQLNQSEVVEILQGAGFNATSLNAMGPFEYREGSDSVLIADASTETLITFENDRVDTVSPGHTYRIDGVELSALYASEGPRRRPVTVDEVPTHLIDAIVSMEDHRFYEHAGVDVMGILRALAHNAIGSSGLQGGSTLTQQLAKNLFLSPERTLQRKLRELFIAFALEYRLSKTQILELYLNQVYLGQMNGVGVGGVDQAARVYFGKTAATLSLGESAVLAGLISSPNPNSPVRHPQRALERRNIVLNRLHELGRISASAKRKASVEPLSKPKQIKQKLAPWAVDYALETMEQLYRNHATTTGSMKVGTTIDLSLQHVAEKAVGEGMRWVRQRSPGAQVALIAMDARNGNIQAMIGSASYRESTFNRAVHGRRHIGSTVKGLTWLFAYEADASLRATTLLPDAPLSIPAQPVPWSPRNFDGKYLGTISGSEALRLSRNIPAVHMAQTIGFEAFSKMLQRVGLHEATTYPSVALGAFDASPLELAAAYGVFPNLGQFARPRIIRSIRLPDGSEGADPTVDKYRIVGPRSAYMVVKDLERVVSHGTGRVVLDWLPSGISMGGKTGTTNDERDAWFVGFVGDSVIAVWVGMDKGKSLGLTGAEAAAPIWARFVAGSGLTPSDRMEPQGLQRDVMCKDADMVASVRCLDTVEVWHQDSDVQKCTLHGRGKNRPTSWLDTVRSAWFKRKGRESTE